MASAVQYTDVHPTDGRYGTVLQIIRNSFLDLNYSPSWVIHSLKTVKNLGLFQQFKTKSEDLRNIGRDVSEHDMFTCYKTMDLIKNILEHGLQTRQSSFNFLGDSRRGVNLCRHADIQLKAAENTGQEECYLIIYKVMLGRSLPVYPSPDNQQLAPTDDFDSHISSVPVDNTVALGQQAIRSQVFCYEYINAGQLSPCPRHVLPYVVVCYKRARALSIPPPMSMAVQHPQPVVQPPLPPLVQMAPAPKPSTHQLPSLPRFYHQLPGDMAGVPAFQPRMPPRNPFAPHPLSTIPTSCAPPYVTGPRLPFPGVPEMRMSPLSHDVTMGMSASMMIPNVQRTDHHPTGMRLPYVTQRPPVSEPSDRIMFNQPHMPPNVALPSPHRQGQQQFGIFHSTAPTMTTRSSAPGMSVPLQVPSNIHTGIPTSIPTGTPATRADERDNTGMRLPIVIQPEVTPPDIPAMGTSGENHQMRLPTFITHESQNQPLTHSDNMQSTSVDVKPDISKLNALLTKRKQQKPEQICIDQDEDTSVKNNEITSPTQSSVIIHPEHTHVIDNPELAAALDLTANKQVVEKFKTPTTPTPQIKSPATTSTDIPEINVESNATATSLTRDNETTIYDHTSDTETISYPTNPDDTSQHKISKKLVVCQQNESTPEEEIDIDGDEDNKDNLPDLLSSPVGLPRIDKFTITNNDPTPSDTPISSRSAKRENADNAYKQRRKKKRKRDPFLVTKPRRRKRRSVQLNKKLKETSSPDTDMSLYSNYTSHDLILQENHVFRIRNDGTVDMYYDIYEKPSDIYSIGNYQDKIGSARTLILVDEGLRELDFTSMLNELDDSIEFGVDKGELSNPTSCFQTDELKRHASEVYVDTPEDITKRKDDQSSETGVYVANEGTETIMNLADRLTETNSDAAVMGELENVEHTGSIGYETDETEKDTTKHVMEPEEVTVHKSNGPVSQTVNANGVHCDEPTGDINHDHSVLEPASVEFIAHTESMSSLSDTESTMTPESLDKTSGWSNIHTHHRFQPTVVIEDVRLTTEWTNFFGREDENMHSDSDGALTLQITSVKSLRDPGISGFVGDESFSAVQSVECDMSCPGDVNNTSIIDEDRQRTPEKKVEHLGQKRKDHTIVDYTSSSADSDSVEDSSESTNLFEAKAKLEKELQELEGEIDSRDASHRNSPDIDVSALESMGTQLSLLRDLGKDSSEKRDMVLHKLSQVRKELNKQSTGNNSKSTLDLFLHDSSSNNESVPNDEHSKEDAQQQCSEQMNNGYHQSGGATGSESDRSRVRDAIQVSPSRDSSSSKSSYSKRSSGRDNIYNSTSDRNSYKRSRSRRKGDRHSRSRYRHKAHHRSERHRSRSRHRTAEHNRTHKHDVTRKTKDDDTKINDDGQEQGGKEATTDKLEGKDIGVTAEAADTQETTKEENMEEQKLKEKEPEKDSEKWLETCENLFLGKSNKDDTPLFDGYEIEQSTSSADPSQWLNALIRLNAKGKVTSQTGVTSVNKASTDIATAESKQHKSSPCPTVSPFKESKECPLASTIRDPAVSSSPATHSNVRPSNPPSKTNSTKRKKAAHSMSTDEVQNLVSRVLTILKPKETPSASSKCSSDASSIVQQPVPDRRTSYSSGHAERCQNADSKSQRTSDRYPRRKRLSLERQEQLHKAGPPTLWGHQMNSETTKKKKVPTATLR